MIDQTPPIRVGLVGYGFAGKSFHAPLLRATPGLQLKAVASSDRAKVEADLGRIRVVADPLELMAEEDLDLIVIASPNQTHAPLARAALEAGKPVVVDKPFTLTLADARDVLALAERNGLLASVFQNRRWDSDFLGVREVIDSGTLGRITHFESHIDRFRPAIRDRWREKAIAGSGLWFDLGPHLVDQALQLFGLPDRVQANLAAQRTGAETDDWAHVLLDYGSRRVILHGGMMAAGGFSRFVVHGDQGSLVKRKSDRQEAQSLSGMVPGAAGWGEDPDPMLLYNGDGEERSQPTPAGDHRHYYAAIAAALRGSGDNPVPPIQALGTMAVLETAAEAARSGRAVELPLTAEERAAWG